jgi:hypothetical protein
MPAIHDGREEAVIVRRVIAGEIKDLHKTIMSVIASLWEAMHSSW